MLLEIGVFGGYDGGRRLLWKLDATKRALSPCQPRR